MRFLLAPLFAAVAFAQPADALRYTPAVLAGSDWVGDNGPATQALLFQAEGLATDLSGNIYIADAQGHRVRQVSRAGVIRTIAGTGQPGFSGDGGSASAAQLNSPYGLAFDNRGNLYIADLGNGRVRRVNPDLHPAFTQANSVGRFPTVYVVDPKGKNLGSSNVYDERVRDRVGMRDGGGGQQCEEDLHRVPHQSKFMAAPPEKPAWLMSRAW